MIVKKANNECRAGKQTMLFPNKPRIIGRAAVVMGAAMAPVSAIIGL